MIQYLQIVFVLLFIFVIMMWGMLRVELQILKAQIERMKVGQKNQEDREKQLLERIKFLEANQK